LITAEIYTDNGLFKYFNYEVEKTIGTVIK